MKGRKKETLKVHLLRSSESLRQPRPPINQRQGKVGLGRQSPAKAKSLKGLSLPTEVEEVREDVVEEVGEAGGRDSQKQES